MSRTFTVRGDRIEIHKRNAKGEYNATKTFNGELDEKHVFPNRQEALMWAYEQVEAYCKLWILEIKANRAKLEKEMQNV